MVNFENSLILRIEQFRIFHHFTNSSIIANWKISYSSNLKFLGMRVKVLNSKILECQMFQI